MRGSCWSFAPSSSRPAPSKLRNWHPTPTFKKLDRFRDLPAKATEDNFVPYNRSFHETITGLSGNRRMADYSRDLVEQFDRLVRVSISMTPPRDYDEFLREHCDIIDALQARDGRRAARLVGAHIERGEKRIIAMLARAQIVP